MLCPEDGGPYKTKPLFFSSREAWAASPHRDGFVIERLGDGVLVCGRFGGRVVSMERANDRVRYWGDGFDLAFDPNDVAATAAGTAVGPVDLTPLRIMSQIVDAMTASDAVNYVSATLERAAIGRGSRAVET